jgi:hypothetical protein
VRSPGSGPQRAENRISRSRGAIHGSDRPMFWPRYVGSCPADIETGLINVHQYQMMKPKTGLCYGGLKFHQKSGCLLGGHLMIVYRWLMFFTRKTCQQHMVVRFATHPWTYGDILSWIVIWLAVSRHWWMKTLLSI